ncbi:MAG: metal-dependent hydrolase [Anaerolineae bacterium]|nr:metal-dependent hydrolase [Anaerolineae bacterium]
MKGITHFLTGVALATCLPEVVALAREGSLLPVLGGVAGLLPDLLDFRFVRYLEHYDVAIDPGPILAGNGDNTCEAGTGAAHVVTPEAALVAAETVIAAFANTMREAFETGTPRRLVAHTVRRGADLWRRYTVCIDSERHAVSARIGPLVTTSQAAIPGSEPPDAVWVEHPLDFPLVHSYRRAYDIDIFTGPSFCFHREGDGLVIDFLDWHHRWTHSLPLALVIGLVAWVLGSHLGGNPVGRLAGLVSGLAFAAHALEDQLGHMGCNLFWPFTRRRQRGLGLLHAADPAPNFLTVWTALALILYNLDRTGAAQGPGLLPAAPYFAVAIAGPWLFYAAYTLWRRARAAHADGEVVAGVESADAERVAELQDGEGR